METTLLVKSIIGLSVLFGFLVVMLVLNSRKKKRLQAKEQEKKQEKSQKDPYISLNDLYKVIRKRSSSVEELKEALDMIIKHHGKIHSRVGSKSHADMDIYAAIMFTLCRHPNVNKDLIINFDRELEKLNPEYVKEINDALEKGLNSRGF